jgi:hypothetical protein
MTRLLVISDVGRWKGNTKLFDEIQPEVVLLPGDLTYDGGLDRQFILMAIPAYAHAYDRLLKAHKVTRSPSGFLMIGSGGMAFEEKRRRLADRWLDSPEFLEAYRKLHVAAFYRFLRHAGKRAKVLVTDGNHDQLPFYSAGKVNDIPGCREISGKQTKAGGLTFVGLGWEHGRIKTNIRALADRLKVHGADVLMCHAPQQVVPIIADRFMPRLMVRGHYGYGCYYASDVPTLFSQGARYSTIELGSQGEPEMRQFASSGAEITEGNCLPRNWPGWPKDHPVQPNNWAWLRPYRPAAGR